MSKIDEIIATAQEYSDADFSHDELVVSVRDLYCLVPYVELAEMIIDINITCDLKFRSREDYLRFGELYQQIKEQQ